MQRQDAVGVHTHKHSLGRGVTHLLTLDVLTVRSLSSVISSPNGFSQTQSQRFRSLKKYFLTAAFLQILQIFSVYYLFCKCSASPD